MSFVVYLFAVEVGFDELHLAFLDNLCRKKHQQNFKHMIMISYAQYNKMIFNIFINNFDQICAFTDKA